MEETNDTSSKESKFPSYKDHLNKTFLEELNYKIWTTKGSRFNANKRLNTVASLSNLSMAVLSCYLIIVSLIGVYQIINDAKINNDIAFISTGLSILILVISQIENAKDYRLRAHLFHHCALQLGRIYNELRIFKTFEEHTDDEKVGISKKLGDQYQSILDDSENHDDIDYDCFKLQNSEYFELTRAERISIRFKRYYRTKLIYHIYIATPPIICVFIYIRENM